MNLNWAKEPSLFLLRVVTGFVFFQFGAMKLFEWFGGMPDSTPTIEPWTQIWTAGVLELVGGALVALGLLTRATAFILSGEMAVAYFQAHFPNGPWPAQNQGTAAVLFCFIFLFFFGYGAGPWSLDALIAGHPRQETERSTGSRLISHF